MPSLRQRFSTYFRQLSFHNEVREKSDSNIGYNPSAITSKYLQGRLKLRPGPEVIHGETANDLPITYIGPYELGSDTIIASHTGPNGGLCTIHPVDQPKPFAETADIKFIDEPSMPESVQDSIRDERTTGVPSNASDGSNGVKKLPTCEKDFSQWSRTTDYVYGISDTLYETNQATRLKNGEPIADCFGIIARSDSVIMAVADGVNWGEKACIAAKSAIYASLQHVNAALFNDNELIDGTINRSSHTNVPYCRATTNRDVFDVLLNALRNAHFCILRNGGMCTTLTLAVVLPIAANQSFEGSDKNATNDNSSPFVCCCLNVGDSPAYIYSPKYGVRELTKASRNIHVHRDMRDALGALGPANGMDPDLNNLTLTQSSLDAGDIVMLVTDGLSDNFDPNVCHLTSEAYNNAAQGSRKIINGAQPTSTEKPPSSVPRHIKNKMPTQRAELCTRSKTTLELKATSSLTKGNTLHRNGSTSSASTLPRISSLQRYELQILLLEEIIRAGFAECPRDEIYCARKLCKTLMSFAMNMTANRRKTLEDRRLYYNIRNGILSEISALEKRSRRRKCIEQMRDKLPGKLDHVSVVAWNVANKSHAST